MNRPEVDKLLMSAFRYSLLFLVPRKLWDQFSSRLGQEAAALSAMSLDPILEFEGRRCKHGSWAFNWEMTLHPHIRVPMKTLLNTLQLGNM